MPARAADRAPRRTEGACMEEQQTDPQIEPTEEPHGTDWKAECRKWEKRAKENDRAAKELAEIREQQKSDLELNAGPVCDRRSTWTGLWSIFNLKPLR